MPHLPIAYHDTQRINHAHGRRYDAVLIFHGRVRATLRHFTKRIDANIYGLKLVWRYKRLTTGEGGF
jgi:hypothetical protein